MKSNRILIGLAAAALLASSCKDQMAYGEYDDAIDHEYISNKWDKVGGFLIHVYRNLDYDFGQKMGGAMLSSACDESVYSHQGNQVETFYNGTWSPSNTNSSVWNAAWQGISYANLYLDEFNNLKFESWALDEKYAANMNRYNNHQYEARWGRAMLYFELVKRYGALPLKRHNLSSVEANALPRLPADSIFAFIDSECEAIKDTIIKDYSKADFPADTEDGRANSLAVLALRARAALYHASPLFNPAGDKDRWGKAILACKEALDASLKQGKQLYEAYDTIFNSQTNYSVANKEIIFAYRAGNLNSYEKYNFPIGMANAGGGNCPTQNLVDAYEMVATGLPITDPASGYDPANPYAGRDPRMASTVAVNGETWPATNGVTLQTYKGGANGLPTSYATPTGYYLKKYCQSTINITTSKGFQAPHNWVMFRMGELYLNLAEAIINYVGDGYTGATVDGVTVESAASYINAVRNRAGMPNIQEGLSADEFMQRYRNERFVELAFEGHRFFDLRRWKVAGDAQYTTIKSMDMTVDASGKVTEYNVVSDNTTRANWNDKMYFFPIPQGEMLKTTGGWEQNPGW